MSDNKKRGTSDAVLIIGILLVILYFYSKAKGQS
jgi:hypothetical protein